MPENEETKQSSESETSTSEPAAGAAGTGPVKAKKKAAKGKKVPASKRKRLVAKGKASAGAKKPVKGKAKPAAKPAKDKKDDQKGAAADDDEPEVEIVDEEEDEELDEELYQVKLKPKLTKGEKKMLKTRQARKDKQPKFRRQEWFRYKKLGDSWRKPRGLHSKTRKNVKYRPSRPRIGFGTPEVVRGRHPSGFKEVMVHRPSDLEGLDPKTQAARIGHQVGTRKRIAIEDRADELGIRILNRGSM
jgi:large subunit ribosomal protein L32e